MIKCCFIHYSISCMEICMMISLVINRDRCNLEFKKMVDKRILQLSKERNIVCKVRYVHDEFNRYTGAIITYKKKS